MQYDLSELMRLAQSPAGQQLMALLRQRGGSALDTAVEKASSGDFESAKNTLSALLSTDDAKVLLKKLEEGR